MLRPHERKRIEAIKKFIDPLDGGVHATEIRWLLAIVENLDDEIETLRNGSQIERNDDNY